MQNDRQKILLSWSSGKDSAWALHVLRQRDDVEVCGLITSLNQRHERVAMHGVREKLLDAQARAAGLPLRKVDLPDPCTNEIYEERMDEALGRAKEEGITGIAFGDLFLTDIREYRERQVARVDLEPIFPIWECETRALAYEMVRAGVRAVLTCVDPKQCPREFAGRVYDETLLQELPESVDPCGENGEFHTFTYQSPTFRSPIEIEHGEVVQRGDFVFADVIPRS